MAYCIHGQKKCVRKVGEDVGGEDLLLTFCNILENMSDSLVRS